MIIIYNKLIRISGGILISALLAATTGYLRAQVTSLPITPPITPPTLTVTLTPSPTGVPSATPSPTLTPSPSLTPTLTPSPTLTPTPLASEGLSTGGVSAKWGSTLFKLEFNAHSRSGIQGNVNYSDNTGKLFKGDVSECYFQSGNEAVFAGTVKSGNVPEQFFLVKVQDNGEGKKSSPDRLGVWLTDVQPLCTLGGYPAEVTKGNLQVH